MDRREVRLPAQFALAGRVTGNPVRQLFRPETPCEVTVSGDHAGRDRWLLTSENGRRTLVVPRRVSLPDDVDQALMVREVDIPVQLPMLHALGNKVRWLRPETQAAGSAARPERLDRCSKARSSWKGRFLFKEERREGGEIVEEGLRIPQRGALHAALAHWSVSVDPATIVMPTGTGKTETMLALLAHQRPERLLVVVPNTALRGQTAAKFETFGVLVHSGVVSDGVLYPVVGRLEHLLDTPDEVEEYFEGCNVVVTTMSVVGRCGEDVRRRMAEMCSHLFIDEAHHVPAPTWEAFRRLFAEKPVLQFTATPYRGDGRQVEGKIIYDYPLRKAQAEDYFRTIDFRAVREFRSDRADDEIARETVERLERDRSDGYRHVVMARASSIERARQVHEIYERLAPEHEPLLIHSKKSATEKREALRKLCEGESTIAVCVNMLGEGFDLPELKIAALHDTHKSLPVTLQFVGRFTRAREDLGGATVIANVADPKIARSLDELYARDPDWNLLLPTLSEGATGYEVRRAEFIEGFADVPVDIPLQNVLPKMSTVVYRTNCADWEPDGVAHVINEARLYHGPTVNRDRHVLLFVTREREPVPWGLIRGIHNTVWDLYLLHWDPQSNLLYINSSNNASLHEDLARALAGEDVDRVRGEQVFRALHGMNRTILMNLGLGHSLSRAVRFTMHAGPDIREGLAASQLQNRYKSNLFARGYENGEKASVGVSYKGRVWSHRAAKDVSEWVSWCHFVGGKLTDESIAPERALDHVLVFEQVNERPELVPLAISWPEDFYRRSEEAIYIDVAGERVPFYEAGLEITEHSRHGPLRYRVLTESRSAEYEMRFSESGVEHVPTGPDTVEVMVSNRSQSLTDRFREDLPQVWLENGAILMNELLQPPSSTARSLFDPAQIEVWDWSGTDIKKESQGRTKLPDSIQRRVIEELLEPAHDPRFHLVFDDDASNEAADVVAVGVDDEHLTVHLFHCKYSSENYAGGRIKDLYEVCGQAQRSVFWRDNPERLLTHLRYRAERRLREHSADRFELGGFELLDDVARQVPFLTPRFKIWVVQPGLSKGAASDEQRVLLAVTELYLRETHALELGVIASA